MEIAGTFRTYTISAPRDRRSCLHQKQVSSAFHIDQPFYFDPVKMSKSQYIQRLEDANNMSLFFASS